MIYKKQSMKFSFFVFLVLMAFQVHIACGVDCSPKYSPSGQMKKIDIKDLILNIIVEDPRDDKEKHFFLWSMGWKSWDPDATKFNGGQKLFLTSKPKDILKEALSDSFLNAGYNITDQIEGIMLRFKLNKFLYTVDTWKNGPIVFAEVSLNVSVEENGRCWFAKDFYERSHKPFDAFHQVEDAEPVLSKCLSKIVEEVAIDGELKLAILKRRPQTTATSTPAETPEAKVNPQIPKTVTKASQEIEKPAANTTVAEPNFVIRVVEGLSCCFPEGDAKGVWLSTVPKGLEVFAFPKGYIGKFRVFSDWVTNKTNTPYYLGKTPLLAEMKKGTYDILFVHPPIKQEEYQIKYRDKYMKYSNIKMQEPLSPFIAQRLPVVYAVYGVLYFTEEREIEVIREDKLETAIVLFQRDDQTVADMLKSMPTEEGFNFNSAYMLGDPNILIYLIDKVGGQGTDKLSEQEVKEILSVSLTEAEIADAEKMLKRTGIWAKKYSGNQSFSIEVRPDRSYWFEFQYPLVEENRKGWSRRGFRVEGEPDSVLSQGESSKSVVADNQPVPKSTARSTLDSGSNIVRDSNPPKSLPQDNLVEASKKGPVEAQAFFEKDKEFQIIMEKANQGDAEAQYEVGRKYYIGPLNYAERESKDYKRHEKDFKKEALTWWTKAAEHGHTKAQCVLGAAYFQGLDIASKDYEESSKWYRMAAEQEHSEAQYNLGEHYLYGYGVAKDNKEAFKWFKMAAGKGHVDAEYQLGMIYCKGQGVSQDYKEAIQWFRKSAEQGHGKAQCELASEYYEGRGTEQDYNEAAKWYARAANIRQVLIPYYDLGLFIYIDEENIEACYKLGQIYQYGQGVVKDVNEAFKWYKKAAKRGHKEAQFELGNMYCENNVAKQDSMEAYKWYILSGNQGCTDAVLAKVKIKISMTSENISEAEKRAESFKIAKNKYNSLEYFWDVRPGEIEMRTYIELTDEDIARAKRKGFSLPDIPKVEIPAQFSRPPVIPPQSPIMKNNVQKQNKSVMPENVAKLLPGFKEELKGTNPVRVRNPNEFSVITGIRSGESGQNLDVPAHGVRTAYVPNGRYDIYFVYSNKPDALYQGDSFTLNNNGVEIQIVQIVNGNYNIRKVK